MPRTRAALLSLLPLVAGLHVAAPLASQVETVEGRSLELEDYYGLKRVGAPAISPGGEWVVYTVSTPVEETNDDRSETWLVPANGSGEPVRVTHEGSDVTSPSWSDDGRLRYEREDGSRWLVVPGGTSAPAPDEEGDSDGELSPDGAWVAVVRDLPVAPAPEPEWSDFERRHQDRFEGVQFDWYPFVRDGRPFPLPDPAAQPMREIYLEPADGEGDPRQLTRLGLRPGSLSWRADGQVLLFTADEAVRDPLAYGRPDLFLVTVGGELTRLTDDGFSYSGVDFSPDGRWISYVRSWGTDFIIDRKLDHGGPRDLYVRPADGGEPVNLTADFDLDAGSPRWSPDSRYLYFTTGIGGAVHLFRVSASGGPVEQVTRGERRILGLDTDGALRRMTYLVGEFDRPPEVWTADIDGGNERRLTNVHADFLAEVSPSRWERVRYESYDGTPIEGFLLHPHGFDPAAGGGRTSTRAPALGDPSHGYPLIIVNHGGPHSASGYGFNFKNQLFAAHGYFVFLPNFRSSTGYGDDFKWGTWGAWGTNDGEDVLAGVDHLVERYPIDVERVGTTGHSYGGILTNWLITRYPDRFKAAVSGAGASNWTSNYAHSDVARTKELEFFGRPWEPEARAIMIRQSPYLNSGGVKAATLFVHGEVDYRVPLEGAIQLYTSLKKQGVPAELIIYEGMAHGIRGHWNVVHRMMHELRWWETYLKPVEGGLASDGADVPPREGAEPDAGDVG
ncbi:MAG: S9 family peptidase [Gemmatimonadales bacterium]|nr:MAG: S9 family peptidase [Gemmatimonadales bacterium]